LPIGRFLRRRGESSTNRAFVSGQATAVGGITVGVYLFRNAGLPELTT
jgi:hypothetical protein